jgi:hypothetical protein
MKKLSLITVALLMVGNVAFAGNNDDCPNRHNKDRAENPQKMSERVASLLGKSASVTTQDGRTNK